MDENNKIKEIEDTNTNSNIWIQLLEFSLTHSMFGDLNNTD